MKFAVACLLGVASAQIVEVRDTQQCIQDLEGLVPGVEKVIQDLKDGNDTKAKIDLALLLPKAEAAYKECTGSGNKKAHHKIMKLKQGLKHGSPQDLPTCISDIEALIPGLESVIADFKAGNYEKALADGMALLPDAEKAYTDCLSSKPMEFKRSGFKDLPTCISDIEALIPGLEGVIADFKAGNYEKALADGLALLPDAEKAATDCLDGKKLPFLKAVKGFLIGVQVGDLPTCISDIEALIPGLEKVIADFKAGNYEQALADGMALLPDAEKAYTDCTATVPKEFKPIARFGDLPTCISDIEALIPGLEGVIADFKAGNYEKALEDGMALLPDAEKAYTDCLSSKPVPKEKMMKVKGFLEKFTVGDLPTCIADVEALIPGVEKVIADFKAGNYEQALADGMALLPDAEKAYTDCTASAKQFFYNDVAEEKFLM